MTLVEGEAGSGKSTLLAAAAAERAREHGESFLFISSSRRAAARMTEELAQGLDSGLGASRSMTWPAVAFDLLARAEARGLLPWMRRAPRLRTGAEQDHRYSELLDRVDRTALPDSLKLAAETRGLRQQLREFADQALQAEADPEADVVRLAEMHGVPEWALAGELMSAYRQQDALAGTEALDALQLSLLARHVLEANPGFAREELSQWGLIAVDDAQNMSAPELALLEWLADPAHGSARVLVSLDSASAVQTFRGADPAATRSRLREAAVRVVELGGSRRMSGQIAAVYADLVSRLGERSARSVAGASPGDGARVETALVSHTFHEPRLIGARILELVVSPDSVLDFGDIAVVVRSGAQARQIERQLTALGVPVEIPPAVLTLKETPAARPLISVMQMVVDPAAVEPVLVTEVLSSPLVGMTSVDIRAMRRRLRAEERERLRSEAEGSSAAGAAARLPLSDELLISAVEDPVRYQGLPGVGVLSAMVAAGRRAYEQTHGDPQHVLWAIWSESRKAPVWRSRAAGQDRSADRANRDLDAVMSLFYAAERFMDQRPGGAADEFLEELLEQEVPVDTVAKQSRGVSAVSVLTPASAAGREFEAVFIAGVQEGQWPNPRIRGEMFRTSDFTDALAADRDGRAFTPALRAERVAEVKRDELRLFLVALSRARRLVTVTAVQGDEESPSLFFDLTALALGRSPEALSAVVPPRPLTLRALIGELRQAAESGTGPAARDSSRVLGEIAASSEDTDAQLARPESWWGSRGLSSTGPILPESSEVRVSPSKVQSAVENPFVWFLQSIGAEPATDFSRQLGTMVHRVAELHPEGTLQELQAAFEEEWATAAFPDNASSRLERMRGDQIIRRLSLYVLAARKAGRRTDADHVEIAFEHREPRLVGDRTREIVISGSIDRLEADGKGGWSVVDLKTSKTALSKAEALKNPQMAVYQYVAAQGALEGVSSSREARLVYIGTSTGQSAAERDQPGDGAAELASELLGEAAEVMTGSAFAAVEASSSRSGPFPDMDPTQPRGRPVTRVDDPGLGARQESSRDANSESEPKPSVQDGDREQGRGA